MDHMLTDQQLTEWSALCEKATPGPWTFDTDEFFTGNIFAPPVEQDGALWQAQIAHVSPEDSENPHDVYFIAAARTAVPALIAEVWRLRRRLDAVLDIRYNEP